MTWTSPAQALSRGSRPLRIARHVSASAPAILLAVSAAAAMAYFFTFLRPVADSLDGLLPVDPADADPTVAVLSAIGLAALTVGLVRGKSVAWWLAMATLSVSLLAQARALSHPLGVIVVGGLLAILLADRRRYVVETAIGWRRLIVALVVVGGLAVGLETSLIIATTGDWPRPLSALSDITAAIGNAFGLSDATADRVLHQTSRDAILGLLLVASRLPIVLAAVGVLSRVSEPPPDPTTRARARAIADDTAAARCCRSSSVEDKLVFAPPDADGLVVYGLAGRTAVMLGDLIGPAEVRAQGARRFPGATAASSIACRSSIRPARPDVQRWSERASASSRWARRLSSISRPSTRPARGEPTCATRSPVAAKTALSSAGSPTASRPRSRLCSTIWRRIDATWRKKAGPQLGFTISHFDRATLAWQPISVAVSPTGRALAYTTFRKTGVDGGWVLDLMRRAPDGPPGAVEACIAEAAIAFRAAGARTLSLGLAPLAGLDHLEPRVRGAPARHRRQARPPLYDVDGLARFKNKFDPYLDPALRGHSPPPRPDRFRDRPA